MGQHIKHLQEGHQVQVREKAGKLELLSYCILHSHPDNFVQLIAGT